MRERLLEDKHLLKGKRMVFSDKVTVHLAGKVHKHELRDQTKVMKLWQKVRAGFAYITDDILRYSVYRTTSATDWERLDHRIQ